MKILYVHRTQGRGAEGVHITSVVRAFRELGHTVDILSPPGIDPFESAGDSPVDKSTVKTTGIRSLWSIVSNRFPQWFFEFAEIAYNVYIIPALFMKLVLGNYDFLFERYAFFSFAPAVATSIFGIPRALEINEVCGIKRARDQKFTYLMELFEKYTFKKADALFPVSSFLKRKIIGNGIPEEKVYVIPNAVHSEVFQKSGSGNEVRETLGLGDKIVIGFAGWFDEWDRLEKIVEIFQNLRQIASCHLLLIGSGKMMGDLKKLIRELGIEADVTLTGPVSRSSVLSYIDAIDVAVITHSNEFGSPMVLFEFIALGKCVVAPRLDPMTDVLESGTDALLFEPGNWDELHALLEKTVTNDELRGKLGNSAREKTLSHHTWQANVKNVLVSMKFTS